MTKFTGTTCIALTWDSNGDCRGVALRGRGERCVVKGYWHSPAGTDESIMHRLREGMHKLGGTENTLVVAGQADAPCGMANVVVPALKTEEMRNALAFELVKYCPLGPERSTWGFRKLGKTEDERQKVRLFFMRQTVWEDWLNAVAGLHLDALIPPQAALDPLLSECEIGLPETTAQHGRQSILTRPDENGVRGLRAPEDGGATKAAFGEQEKPLEWEGLDISALAEVSSEEQHHYAAAIILAAYGLTDTVASDRETGFPIPYELRPRRNRMNRLLAVLLLFSLVALVCGGAWREYDARKNCLNRLRSEKDKLEKKLETEMKKLKKNGGTALEEVAAELQEANAEVDRPSLAAVLVDLSEIIDPQAWCQSLEWRDSALIIKLTESEEIVDLVRNLDQSQVLGDVVETSTRVAPNGEVSLTLNLNARWDTENEYKKKPEKKEAPPIPDPALKSPASKKKNPLKQLPGESTAPRGEKDAIRRPPAPTPPAMINPQTLKDKAKEKKQKTNSTIPVRQPKTRHEEENR